MFQRLKQFLAGLLPKAKPGTKLVEPPAHPQLSQGDSGLHVKDLQSLLKGQGFFPGEVGGNFGPKTKSGVIAFQQTHLDASGNPLVADGVVGKSTWWALYNPSGVAQKLGLKAPEPAALGLSAARQDVLAVCKKLHQEGTHEIPDGSNSGDGVTKFHEWFGMRPAAWCAMAYNWVIFQVLQRLPWGSKEAHVATLYTLCKKVGMTHAALNSGYQPRPGDAYVIVHPDGTGHIGIIAAVSVDGKGFLVYEGNSGNRFALRFRRAGEGHHRGYINCFGDADTPPNFQRGFDPSRADGANSNTR